MVNQVYCLLPIRQAMAGPQYVNATITELLRLLGTEHVRTIAHSHEEKIDSWTSEQRGHETSVHLS